MAGTADQAIGRADLTRTGRETAWPHRPDVPWWMTWAPRAALSWALLYGAVRAWWAAGAAPSFGPSGRDLVVFGGWSAVGLCVAAAGLALALMVARWRRGLLVAAWGVSAAFLVAGALLLLDVVGGLLPGLGVPFHGMAFASRVGSVGEGLLLGAAAVAYRRCWRSDCMFCGRAGVPMPRPSTPWWAWCSAYVAVAGCLVRLAAQLAVGFEGSLLQLSASLLVFEAGFILAGTVLPLALVHSWGRKVPRWVPLLAGRPLPRWLLLGPAFAIAVAMTAYFGFSLVTFAAQALTGSSAQIAGALPVAFFWVALPAYLVWGLALGVAAIAYYRVTRPRCRVCGR